MKIVVWNNDTISPLISKSVSLLLFSTELFEAKNSHSTAVLMSESADGLGTEEIIHVETDLFYKARLIYAFLIQLKVFTRSDLLVIRSWKVNFFLKTECYEWYLYKLQLRLTDK